ncbi:MAG: (2Fe-2S)-binding protein [Burkholderiales bacterium]|nr:(2Fe-2S)-binding protein [Burkholderiales bacterium]
MQTKARDKKSGGKIVRTFTVNGRRRRVTAFPDQPLLWVLREKLGLTGTKFGCGIAACGACMVHIDGRLAYSCQRRFDTLGGRAVTTIEGLSEDASHPLQKAWVAEQAPQCGYCQSGQIMRAAALLKETPKPDRKQIVQAMSSNLCRCASYDRIVAAIERVVAGGRS